MTELHHNIPISFNGIDKKSNIIELEKDTHKELHAILDLHPRLFSQFMRKIRKQNN